MMNLKQTMQNVLEQNILSYWIDHKKFRLTLIDRVSLNCIITSEHVKLECYNRSFYQNFFCSSDHSKPCVAILASSSFLSTLK